MKFFINNVLPEVKKTILRVPEVTLNSGKKMPMLGLGTRHMTSEIAENAVLIAIDNGYRHIDTATIFDNEIGVGKAINVKLKEGTIKRSALFVTSKLWNCCHEPPLVRPALRKSMEQLKLCYIDMYIMHTPMGFKSGSGFYPRNEKNELVFSNVDFVDTWRELEECVLFGYTRSIGVANFNEEQLKHLLKNCRIKPSVNQVECHPYLTNTKMSEFCNKNGIVMMAYSPFSSYTSLTVPITDKKESLLENCRLKKIAETHMHTIPQILMKYQIQSGHTVIPCATTKEHIVENINILDFQLTAREMLYINDLNDNYRINKFIECEKHMFYPFKTA